jgi:hypothetical protein
MNGGQQFHHDSATVCSDHFLCQIFGENIILYVTMSAVSVSLFLSPELNKTFKVNML